MDFSPNPDFHQWSNMKQHPIKLMMLSVALSVATAPSLATVGKSVFDTPGNPGGVNRVNQAAPKSKVKLVDINHASKTELQTLPGITPVLADKIIAGRPYNSKAFLVTHNIIPEALYHNISASIGTASK